MSVKQKRFALLLLGLSICALLTVGFGPPTLIDREIAPSQRLTVGQLRQMQEAHTLPPVSSRALLLYDVDADQVLLAHNEHLALPPASLTKLMTALLILEQDELQASVTIQGSDLVGGTSMGLRAGEVLTVEELLWGMLIPSGNDAAVALARHSAGSVDVFVQRMNIRAEELGLAQTHFANPHGFDAEGHTSSAADLLALTLRDLAFPLFREIVSTASTTVAGHRLRATNQLLGTLQGADGVKTGTTAAAGQSLVASVTREGHRVLMVLLGSSDRYADARAVYARYQQNYVWGQGEIRLRPTALDRLYDQGERLWVLAAEGDPPQIFLPRWQLQRLRLYRQVQPPSSIQPWTAGMTAGMLQWRLGDEVIATQRLYLR